VETRLILDRAYLAQAFRALLLLAKFVKTTTNDFQNSRSPLYLRLRTDKSMRIFKGIDHLFNFQKPVVTSGTFDGVHKGHQKILRQVIESAQKNGGESVLLTYWPHPRLITQPQAPKIPLLTTLEEKLDLLEKIGLQNVILLTFDQQLANTASRDFVQQILIDKINTHQLIIGYDHKFGKNREGSFEYLQSNAKNLGFQVEEIQREDIDNMAISSTSIRNAIKAGDIQKANELLGYQFTLSGTVVRGKQIGRTLNFPTANILLEDQQKIVPPIGVYAVQVYYEHTYYAAMLNIGYRPTVAVEKGDLSIEVHIFDFEKEIYGQNLRIYFVQKIRDEQTFPDTEALRHQLIIDAQKSKTILARFA